MTERQKQREREKQIREAIKSISESRRNMAKLFENTLVKYLKDCANYGDLCLRGQGNYKQFSYMNKQLNKWLIKTFELMPKLAEPLKEKKK